MTVITTGVNDASKAELNKMCPAAARASLGSVAQELQGHVETAIDDIASVQEDMAGVVAGIGAINTHIGIETGLDGPEVPVGTKIVGVAFAASAPADPAPVEGDTYINTGDGKYYTYEETDWDGGVDVDERTMIYDSTNHKLKIKTDSAWETITFDE